jgi:hypothetical protein
VLGLFRAVVTVLVLLRSNMPQALAADLAGVSQPTVSRVFRRLAPVIRTVLAGAGPGLAEAAEGRVVVVDGTLVPTPEWAGLKANYSGKHRRPGLSIQVLSDLNGRLLAVSDPQPGSTHDLTAFARTGWEAALWGSEILGDKAYHDSHVLTPVRKPRGRPMPAVQKEANKAHSSLRVAVERCIAHLKNWKVLATGYRGRVTELPDVIATVVALEFHRLGWTGHL